MSLDYEKLRDPQSPDIQDSLDTLRIRVRQTYGGRTPKSIQLSEKEFEVASRNIILGSANNTFSVPVLKKLSNEQNTLIDHITRESGRTIARWELAEVRATGHSSFQDPDLPIEQLKSEDALRRDFSIILAATAETAWYLMGNPHTVKAHTPITYHSPQWIDDWLGGNFEDRKGNSTWRLGHSAMRTLLLYRPQDPESAYESRIKSLSTFDPNRVAEILNHTVPVNTVIELVDASSLKRFVTYYSEDKLYERIAEYVRNTNGLMSTLIESGVNPDYVRRNILTSELKYFSKQKKPIEVAMRYLNALATDLSNENLVQHFNLNEIVIESYFPYWVRKKAALVSPSDPISALARYKAVIDKTTAMGLSRACAIQLAVGYNLHNATALAQKAMESLSDKPSRISDGVWLSYYILYPVDEKKRLEAIAQYNLWRQVWNTVSLDDYGFYKTPRHERVGDGSSDPANILFGDEQDADVLLAAVARDAGISTADLEYLLQNYTQDESPNLDPYLNSILERMRHTGESYYQS